jgi:hypothetical protein
MSAAGSNAPSTPASKTFRGLTGSPFHQKILYISDSEKLSWLSYRVQANGSVTDGKVLFNATGVKGVGGPDGIKVDRLGNIWGSGPGGVWILSPEGKHLGTTFPKGSEISRGVIRMEKRFTSPPAPVYSRSG